MGQTLPTSDALLDAGKALYPHLGPHPVALINSSFILVTIGQISLIFLIGTLLFSPYVKKRNATLINLLALSVFESIPPGLLYYSGHILDPNPSFGLCLSQSILRYGSEPMFIVASLALIVELLVETRLLTVPLRRRYRRGFLVSLPYVIFFIFAIWAAALGGSHPAAVKHQLNDLYCSITYTPFGRGIDTLCAVVVAFTISLEIYTHIKHRAIWRKVDYDGPTQGLGTALVLRLIGFTCLQLFYILLLALDFFVGSVATHVIPIAYEALMPLATFVIFGTSMDCLETWKFWDRAAVRARMREQQLGEVAYSIDDDDASDKMSIA